MHEENTWSTTGIKKGINSKPYTDVAFVFPVYVNQLIFFWTIFLLYKAIRDPSVFVTVNDNMTKLTEFCFKIEIQIKIKVPQGRKLLFLSQATSERDREKRKKVLVTIKTAVAPSAGENYIV